MGVGTFPPLEKATGRNINAGKVTINLFRKRSLSKKEVLTSLHQNPLGLLEEVI